MGRRRSEPEPRSVPTAVALALVLLVAACGGPSPSPTPAATVAASPGASPSARSASPVASPEPTSSGPGQSIGTTGAVVLLTNDGSLSMVDAAGRSFIVASAGDGNFGFPTWSPDGSQIAAPRTLGTNKSVVVFDAKAVVAGRSVEPVVIFQSATIDPFYLFWTPDGKAVSFLASESSELSLRIAPADGTAPLDGSGPGAKVRTGNPFYYDWIARDRLLAHVGLGTDAFLGEMRLDGKAAGASLGKPGDFRSAVVSHDRKSIAFVRDGGTGPGQIVVAARDGSEEHTMEVFGSAAVIFDPAGDTLAAIGAAEPVPPAGFPLGPLRLMEAGSGKVRTLIDGLVVSFWWSPDGKTIAALRVQEVVGSGLPSPGQPSAEPSSEVRLVFVDVATGTTRSQPVVKLGSNFVNGILAFFDQYALSHRAWAPDSSSFLLPESEPDGSTHVTVRFPDGQPPILLDGELGFWSP